MEELQAARIREFRRGRGLVATVDVPAVPAAKRTSVNGVKPTPSSGLPTPGSWQSPFMQYSDLTYFPSPAEAAIAAAAPATTTTDDGAEQPKDESHVEVPVTVTVGVPPADTFPSIPEGMYTPKARRSWDRQRKQRRGRRKEKEDVRRRKEEAVERVEERGWDGAGTGPGTGSFRHGGGGGGGGGGEEGGEGSDGGRGHDAGGGGSRREHRSRCLALLAFCSHWIPEIACCLVGTLLMAVIVAVLWTFDGHGLSDWPLTVSLNTLVAFLTTVCQVALAVPLTEGLSQLKWNSFARGDKPLADFVTFEDAKRSPGGAAALVWKRKGRALGMTAATALMTSFLLSPLTQGAITYPTRTLDAGSGTAVLAVSDSYSHPTPYATLDAREKQAIHSGIHHPVDSEFPPLQPLCSTGHCQWPQNASSLAICAAVADVSDRLTISNQTRASSLGAPSFVGQAGDESVRRARLPNGAFLIGSATSANLNISWPHNTSTSSIPPENDEEDGFFFLPTRTSLAFSDQDGRVSSAVANFFLVYYAPQAAAAADDEAEQPVPAVPDPAGFRAVEVLLHFCVNTYQVATTNGVSTSQVVHSATLTTESEARGTLVTLRDTTSSSSSSPSPSSSSSSTSARPVLLRMTSAEGPGVYSVKRDDVRLLNEYIRSVFSGTYSRNYGKAIGGETPVSEALGLAMFGRGVLDEEAMRAAVRNLTANVATSLTNVQWAWLTFLAIQVALSAIFLVGIMIQTAVWNVKILKGSPAAALLAISAEDKAYLETQTDVSLDSTRRESQSSETARKLQAITCRFRPRERGWVLDLNKGDGG
ncbi:hypothetical protein VTJ49DRAFT_5341 [Mycothermus thermophilus]|uniref:Transmembrane protein n=1 Tax=Humicola insolens TaxID=85995 RepID=A0ABR3V3D8_HUMIN